MRGSIGAVACALIVAVSAREYIPQNRHLRRNGITYPINGTYSNSSSETTTSSTSTTSTTSDLPTQSNSTDTSSTDTYIPPSTTPYPLNGTTSTTDICVGSVTYYDSVPPTVYATITEGFDVTVTASNASLPPAQIITPPVACTATVIPLPDTAQGPLLTASSANPCVAGVCYPAAKTSASLVLSFQPALTVITLSPAAAQTSKTKALSASLAPNVATNGPEVSLPSTGSAFTSTVLVTKKTPVAVVPTTTTFVTPNFQIPKQTTTKQPTTTPNGGAANPNPVTNGGTTAGGSNGGSAGGGGGGGNNNPPPPTTSPVGSIINSIINSPFTPVVQPKPTTATLDNVPVVILPSGSAVIGGQIISIPSASSQTTVQVNGQTFTVAASQVVAPGTTYALTPERNAVGEATPNPTPVTAGGLTFSVGVTQAIVSGTTFAIGAGAAPTTATIGSRTVVFGSNGVGIVGASTVAPEAIATQAPETITADGLTFTVGPSQVALGGTTYAIGAGASGTTVVVGGQTISIGSKGVGLAQTTIAPEPIYTVVSAGGLTFSIDSSEAILSGTTYSIGKGAHKTTTVAGSKTLSFGPGGVGLPSTTLPPESTNAFSAGAPGSVAISAPVTGFLGILLALLGLI